MPTPTNVPSYVIDLNKELSQISSELKNKESQLIDLTERISDLESRLPNSNILSHSFFKRAVAIFGHTLAIQLLFLAIYVACILIFTFNSSSFR